MAFRKLHIDRRWLSRSYNEGEKTACVEELVRTHMLAGHTVEDLLATDTRQDITVHW